MKKNEDILLEICLWAGMFLGVFLVYARFFEGTWVYPPTYLKYIIWFWKYQYNFIPFTKINLHLPTKVILILCCTLLTYVVGIMLLRGYFLNIKRVNKKFSFFATWREIKRFKKDSLSVTDKTGVALGVYNLGLLPHTWFTYLYSSRKKNIKKIGKFFLAWKRYILLRMFINYEFLFTEATLSLMCIAPAGTGKTAGVVLPIMFSCDKDCLVINDPKGEIRDLTLKYREKLGKVYVLEWKDVGKSNKWNPFDYRLFASFIGQPKFFTFISDTATRSANILIQETGGDKFWVNSARTMFNALAQFSIYQRFIEGKSTSIAEIKAMATTLNSAQNEIEQQEENLQDESAVLKYKINEMIRVLDDYLIEFLENEDNFPNFASCEATARTSLNVLKNNLLSIKGQPEETRKSIMTTLDVSLLIFDNANVIQNTSSNDIDFLKIREGIDGKPITVFMVTPVSEQKSYGALNGLFVEFLYQYLVSLRTPLETDKTIRFILDEVAFFPPISAVSDAPAITRSFRVSWAFFCQDVEQFKTNWGNAGLENMLTNTAFKIILSQNNLKSANVFAQTIGQTQYKEIRGSRNNKEKVLVDKQLINATQIMSLVNKQIVIVQTKANRPIECFQMFWFKYPELTQKASL